MNGRHETVKVGVPPGNLADPRETLTRGVLEQCVARDVCPELAEERPEDATKDVHVRGRNKDHS